MHIGNQIKKLRKSLMFTQSAFAGEVGIDQSYLSALEKSKKRPSKQLILSICRTYGVNYDWLTKGEGEMYDRTPRFTPKGLAIIEEIIKRIEGSDRLVPLSTVAAVLGIDPDNAPHDLSLAEGFPGALFLLIEIFKEGDKRKTGAVMAQLLALDPRPKRQSTQKKNIDKHAAGCDTSKKKAM